MSNFLDKEIEDAIMNGPTFGQSRFQTHNFVVAKHGMDGRSYRQVLLELNNKYTSLKRCQVSVKRINAQIASLVKKLEQEKDENEQIIIECDIEEKQIDLKQQEKLVADAIDECNFLYAQFKALPKVSNEEFEKQEKEYWEKRLILDAELSVLSTGRIDIGTAMSLVNLGHNPLQLQTDLVIEQNNRMIEFQQNKQLYVEKKD